MRCVWWARDAARDAPSCMRGGAAAAGAPGPGYHMHALQRCWARGLARQGARVHIMQARAFGAARQAA